MNRIQRKVLLPIAFWLSAVAVVEVSLRIARFEFNPYAHYSQKDWDVFVEGRNRVDYLADAEVFWRFIPSRVVMSDFGPGAHINSASMRGPECKIERDPGVLRIVTLGDSGTFGWAVKDEECYPRRLETILNERMAPRRVEVINGGVPGFTSLQGVRWFEHHLAAYKPNIITIAFGGNDGDRLPIADKDRKLAPASLKAQEILLHSRIYQYLYKTIAVDLVSEKRTDTTQWPERVSLEDFAANHEKIAAIADSLGAKMVLIGRPGPRAAEYMGAVEAFAKRHGAPWIPDGVLGHPPASDYDVAAHRIADAILAGNLLKNR